MSPPPEPPTPAPDRRRPPRKPSQGKGGRQEPQRRPRRQPRHRRPLRQGGGDKAQDAGIGAARSIAQRHQIEGLAGVHRARAQHLPAGRWAGRGSPVGADRSRRTPPLPPHPPAAPRRGESAGDRRAERPRSGRFRCHGRVAPALPRGAGEQGAHLAAGGDDRHRPRAAGHQNTSERRWPPPATRPGSRAAPMARAAMRSSAVVPARQPAEDVGAQPQKGRQVEASSNAEARTAAPARWAPPAATRPRAAATASKAMPPASAARKAARFTPRPPSWRKRRAEGGRQGLRTAQGFASTYTCTKCPRRGLRPPRCGRCRSRSAPRWCRCARTRSMAVTSSGKPRGDGSGSRFPPPRRRWWAPSARQGRARGRSARHRRIEPGVVHDIVGVGVHVAVRPAGGDRHGEAEIGATGQRLRRAGGHAGLVAAAGGGRNRGEIACG